MEIISINVDYKKPAVGIRGAVTLKKSKCYLAEFPYS